MRRDDRFSCAHRLAAFAPPAENEPDSAGTRRKYAAARKRPFCLPESGPEQIVNRLPSRRVLSRRYEPDSPGHISESDAYEELPARYFGDSSERAS